MTRRNRETLRQYFGDGQRPTSQHFGDLIDSALNLRDEGFEKTAAQGLHVGAAVGQDALMTFLRSAQPQDALWRASLAPDDDALHIGRPAASGADDEAAPPLLSLSPDGRVGIGRAQPRHALDVAGVVAASGRIGTARGDGALALPADGAWHDITETLTGCQAYEVMAGVGRPGSGQFALLHAVALNTWQPATFWSTWLPWLPQRRTVRASHAHFQRRADRLSLCWEGRGGRDASYRLRIRSGCDYGAGVSIQVSLTQLWFDPLMRGSSPA